MARLPRLCVAGIPHYVVQRGNGGQALFGDDDDRRQFLQLLGELTVRHGVLLHAYCLAPDRFLLLLTPERKADDLSRMMQALGRAYVQRYNRRHARRGTLWEGRYRAAPIEAARYLLPCMAYCDLEPLRQGLAARPQDHEWSSHRHYAGLRQDPLLRPPAEYWALGNTPFEREARYVQRVAEGLDPADLEAFRRTAPQGWALGSVSFVEELSRRGGRRARRLTPGRPGVRKSGGADGGAAPAQAEESGK